MRRRKRIRKNAYLKKYGFIVFFVLVLIMSTAYSLLQQQIDIFGTARLKTNDIEEEKNYSGWGIVETELQTTWINQDGKMVYHYNIIITNTSDANINGWEILMNVPEDASIHASGGGDFSFSEGILTITNAEDENIIPPGGEYKTYIQLATSDTEYELTYLVLNGIRMNLTGETLELVGIKINESKIKLFKRQSHHLTVLFEPYNSSGTVTWSSSNTDIAAVNSATGLITAANPGTCIITATCGNLSDTCEVIVDSVVRESENLRVEFVPGNSWGSGTEYNVQYTLNLTNISDTAISGWNFDVVLPAGAAYQYGWNVTVTNTEGTTYHIEGPQTLQPNVTNTEIGITFIVPEVTYIPIPININP